MTIEPRILRRGKHFHRIVQQDWLRNARDGRINIERTLELTKRSRVENKPKIGRMDLLVDEAGDFVTVVEIKSTDWDKVKKGNIQKLLGSHRRQVWHYIDEYVEARRTDVCPGIIYSHPPQSKNLRLQIEAYMNEYGLQVVWYKDYRRDHS